jgi:hypothetical protein
MSIRRLLAVSAALALLASCASTVEPVLYPNDHYKQVGEVQAQKDVEACKDQAAKQGAGDNSQLADTAKNTAIGAAAGGAIGAVGGAVSGGSAGQGALIGAAIGGTAALIQSALKRSGPDPVFKAHVGKCLKERGYDVIGWD